MKRFLIIALCLAGLAGMAAAQPNPWDPNYYTGTFHGHGDFVPKGNGVWDLGDPGNHWRKAYVDSIIGAALIGYADSSHRADSLKYGAGYFAGTSFIRSDASDSFTILSGDSLHLKALTIGGYPNEMDIHINNAPGCWVGVGIGSLSDGYERGVAVGYNSRGRGGDVAIGPVAHCGDSGTAGNFRIAIGDRSSSGPGGSGIAIGGICSTEVFSGGGGDVGIGFGVKVDSQSIAIGNYASATKYNSGALGQSVVARLKNYFTILNIDNDTLLSQKIYTSSILPPLTAPNTGSIGASGNAFNFVNVDSVKLADSLLAYKIGTDIVARADTFKVISPDNTVRVLAYSNTGSNRIHMPVATDFLAGMLATTGNFSSTITTNGGNITTTKVGGIAGADTISGYNGNTWATSSWGITITGVDTLGKFYMSSFDSLKMLRCWASIKTISIGGDPDTLVYMDSLKTDSVKVTMAVGSLWLAPALLNKKWPTNPGGVLNPVYCIFRKGATTAAANLQVWTTYGLSKGRMF